MDLSGFLALVKDKGSSDIILQQMSLIFDISVSKCFNLLFNFGFRNFFSEHLNSLILQQSFEQCLREYV